ncbi:MAG TPA: serine/threonine-protein kinase [Kofleriaceae bacterium]|nr:serine/threonine-protein kinase [Kofleriaceae bacterium]
MSDPLIGRRFGSYVVSRKLGEGGMGAVYELVHPTIGKRQALKVLHAEYAKKSAIVDRFFAEAKSVVTIGHPNIVDITDFATLEDGTAYIVMEFLEGQSLAGYVKQRGPMQPEELAAIVLPICDALAAAHSHGIVHRDLKPENVHLIPRPDNPRYVKVLDFGIAKLAPSDANAGVPMTKTGQVMGTPMYMSPEQAMGRTREVDHRTDVYALGIMMYQLLTGEVPFQAESFGDLMLMHLSSPPPPLSLRRPDLAPAWDAIIQRALAKSRDERFASMQEVAGAIRAALAGHSITPMPMPAQPATMVMPPGPSLPPTVFAQGTVPAPSTIPPKKSPALWIALGLIAVAAGVAVLIVATSGSKKDTQPIAVTTIDAAPAVKATPPPLPSPPDAAPAPEPPDAAPPAPDAAPPPPDDHHHHHETKPPVVPDAGAKATLRVTAVPWGNVFVDGKPQGQTPATITIPAGRAVKVRVVNPELNVDQTQTVIADPNSTKAVRFTLGE